MGVQTQTGGVVGDGLLEVFALDGLVAFDSLGLCHLLFSFLVNSLLFVVEIGLVVFEFLFVGLGGFLGVFGF